jgi:hypothetical protein
MTRKYIDCREIPSETNCSVAISADTEREPSETPHRPVWVGIARGNSASLR